MWDEHLRSNHCRITLHRTDSENYSTHPQCALLGRPEGKGVRSYKDRINPFASDVVTCTNGMGIVHRVHFETMRVFTFLWPLLKVERIYKAGLLRPTTCGRVFYLHFESANVSALVDNNGNWQVNFDGTVRNKTAFTSNHRQYRIVRITFGFENAP